MEVDWWRCFKFGAAPRCYCMQSENLIVDEGGSSIVQRKEGRAAPTLNIRSPFCGATSWFGKKEPISLLNLLCFLIFCDFWYFDFLWFESNPIQTQTDHDGPCVVSSFNFQLSPQPVAFGIFFIFLLNKLIEICQSAMASCSTICCETK